jgi:predicted phage tail protein
MQELKTIRLLGAAGRKFGREFKIAVKSPAEAFRALCVLCPGLRAWVLEQHEKGVAWRVIIKDRKGVSTEDLQWETGHDVITFSPVMRGAGGGSTSGVLQIVIGVALIAAAIIIPFGMASGGVGLGLLGGSLVLSGVAELITPTPTLPSQATTGEESLEELNSSLFTRSGGNGDQAEVVPVLYGRRLVPQPRSISFDLKILPASRDIDTSGTVGLLGYVNGVDL